MVDEPNATDLPVAAGLPGAQPGVSNADDALTLHQQVFARWHGDSAWRGMAQARPLHAVLGQKQWLSGLSGLASLGSGFGPQAWNLATQIASSPQVLARVTTQTRSLQLGDLAELVQVVLEELELDSELAGLEGEIALTRSGASAAKANSKNATLSRATLAKSALAKSALAKSGAGPTGQKAPRGRKAAVGQSATAIAKHTQLRDLRRLLSQLKATTTDHAGYSAATAGESAAYSAVTGPDELRRGGGHGGVFSPQLPTPAGQAGPADREILGTSGMGERSIHGFDTQGLSLAALLKGAVPSRADDRGSSAAGRLGAAVGGGSRLAKLLGPWNQKDAQSADPQAFVGDLGVASRVPRTLRWSQSATDRALLTIHESLSAADLFDGSDLQSASDLQSSADPKSTRGQGAGANSVVQPGAQSGARSGGANLSLAAGRAAQPADRSRVGAEIGSTSALASTVGSRATGSRNDWRAAAAAWQRQLVGPRVGPARSPVDGLSRDRDVGSAGTSTSQGQIASQSTGGGDHRARRGRRHQGPLGGPAAALGDLATSGSHLTALTAAVDQARSHLHRAVLAAQGAQLATAVAPSQAWQRYETAAIAAQRGQTPTAVAAIALGDRLGSGRVRQPAGAGVGESAGELLGIAPEFSDYAAEQPIVASDTVRTIAASKGEQRPLGAVGVSRQAQATPWTQYGSPTRSLASLGAGSQFNAQSAPHRAAGAASGVPAWLMGQSAPAQAALVGGRQAVDVAGRPSSMAQNASFSAAGAARMAGVAGLTGATAAGLSARLGERASMGVTSAQPALTASDRTVAAGVDLTRLGGSTGAAIAQFVADHAVSHPAIDNAFSLAGSGGRAHLNAAPRASAGFDGTIGQWVSLRDDGGQELDSGSGGPSAAVIQGNLGGSSANVGSAPPTGVGSGKSGAGSGKSGAGSGKSGAGSGKRSLAPAAAGAHAALTAFAQAYERASVAMRAGGSTVAAPMLAALAGLRDLGVLAARPGGTPDALTAWLQKATPSLSSAAAIRGTRTVSRAAGAVGGLGASRGERAGELLAAVEPATAGLDAGDTVPAARALTTTRQDRSARAERAQAQFASQPGKTVQRALPAALGADTPQALRAIMAALGERRLDLPTDAAAAFVARFLGRGDVARSVVAQLARAATPRGELLQSNTGGGESAVAPTSQALDSKSAQSTSPARGPARTLAPLKTAGVGDQVVLTGLAALSALTSGDLFGFASTRSRQLAAAESPRELLAPKADGDVGEFSTLTAAPSSARAASPAAPKGSAGASLTGAKLTGAKLTGAKLTGAKLTGVRMHEFAPAGLSRGRNLVGQQRRSAWLHATPRGAFATKMSTARSAARSGYAGSTFSYGSSQLGGSELVGLTGGDGWFFGEAAPMPTAARGADRLSASVTARRAASLGRGHASSVARGFVGPGAASAVARDGMTMPADFQSGQALIQPASSLDTMVEAAGRTGGATASLKGTQAAAMTRVLSVTSSPAANMLPLVAPAAQAIVAAAAAKPLSESIATSGGDPTLGLPMSGVGGGKSGQGGGGEKGRQQSEDHSSNVQDIEALANKIARSVMVRIKRERERRGLHV